MHTEEAKNSQAQQEPHGSRFQDKLQSLNSRLYEVRNGLHRVEGLLHGGPPETKAGGASPSPGDLQSTVREGHNILDEIDAAMRRLTVSLGLEHADPSTSVSSYGPPPNGSAIGLPRR